MGVLIYLFGVKFAYFGQACDITLSKLEEENEKDNKKRA